MRRFITSSIFASAAAATAIGLSSTPAFAATWTVSGGGGFTGSLSGAAVMTDVSKSIAVSCPNGTAGGSAANGTGLPGTGIGSITSATFGTSSSKCTGPLGSSFTAALKAGSVWSINAVSYDAGTGITSGTVTGVDATMTGSSLLGSCNAEVSGSAQHVTYNNGTHQIAISDDSPPQLTVSNVSGSGCAGLIANGDQATLHATFTVNPATLTITSP
jgi:hypothetical protein